MSASQAKPFKVIVVGDSSVGKTSLTNRLVGIESENPQPTVGVGRHTHRMRVNDQDVPIDIHDTAGMETFRAVVPNFYRHADGALVVFDLTDRQTFVDVHEWVQDVPKNIPIVVVGNKSDLKDRRQVPPEDIEQYTSANGFEFIPTSARNGTHVIDAFTNLIVKMMEVRRRLLANPAEDGGGEENAVIHVQHEDTTESWLERWTFGWCVI